MQAWVPIGSGRRQCMVTWQWALEMLQKLQQLRNSAMAGRGRDVQPPRSNVPSAQPQTESTADADQPHSVQVPRPLPQHEVLPAHVIEGIGRGLDTSPAASSALLCSCCNFCSICNAHSHATIHCLRPEPIGTQTCIATTTQLADSSRNCVCDWFLAEIVPTLLVCDCVLVQPEKCLRRWWSLWHDDSPPLPNCHHLPLQLH